MHYRLFCAVHVRVVYFSLLGGEETHRDYRLGTFDEVLNYEASPNCLAFMKGLRLVPIFPLRSYLPKSAGQFKQFLILPKRPRTMKMKIWARVGRRRRRTAGMGNLHSTSKMLFGNYKTTAYLAIELRVSYHSCSFPFNHHVVFQDSLDDDFESTDHVLRILGASRRFLHYPRRANHNLRALLWLFRANGRVPPAAY